MNDNLTGTTGASETGPAMPHTAAAPTLLTTSEVAGILRVNASTVRRMIEAGDLPAERIGRGYRITGDALAAYRAGRRTGSRPIVATPAQVRRQAVQ